MNKEIAKLKYQVRLLGQSVDFDTHPIPSLVVGLDWDEQDLRKAGDIFQKYDGLLQGGKNPAYGELEQDLRREFHNVGYQEVKTIVNAFYASNQWQNVCLWFAKGQDPTCPSELKHILQDRRK
jgi:hypothetical protein